MKDKLLDNIDLKMIEKLIELKAADGVSNARINRMLALVRAILNKAAGQWGWIDHAPKISMRKEASHRTRWLTQIEAKKLIDALPAHLADMVIFTLATGLRQANVKNLKWEEIDLDNKHAWVHADEAKANKAIAVPLNDDAIAVLLKLKGKHTTHVFSYRGKPLKQITNKTWKQALEKAGISNFRWHDLRHTWASWHVQSGTTLQELQVLGGWSSFSMVLRYAHLSSSHLQVAAKRICVTKSLHLNETEKNRTDHKESYLRVSY